jgi:hypothetical protein
MRRRIVGDEGAEVLTLVDSSLLRPVRLANVDTMPGGMERMPLLIEVEVLST